MRRSHGPSDPVSTVVLLRGLVVINFNLKETGRLLSFPSVATLWERSFEDTLQEMGTWKWESQRQPVNGSHLKGKAAKRKVRIRGEGQKGKWTACALRPPSNCRSVYLPSQEKT